MNKDIIKDVIKSGVIHFPLELDSTKSIEKEYETKKINDSQLLWDGETATQWRFVGEGESSIKEGTLYLRTKARSDHWPETEIRSRNAKKGEYATFGSFEAKLDVSKLKLINGNRIHFKIRPECDGLHSPVIRVAFINDGSIKIPDVYSREGFSCMNLVNHEWNDMYWEIDSIAHDKIVEVSFIVHRYGAEVSTGEYLNFALKDIYFEDSIDPSVKYGWMCHENEVVYPSTGYFSKGKKIAIANTCAETFSLVDSVNGQTVYSSRMKAVDNSLGSYKILDFSDVQQDGIYHIVINGIATDNFEISCKVADSTIWKLLNFIYCERCGFPIPNKHGTCHQDVVAEYNGTILSAAGGWHDAADVSQEMCQTGETIQSLLEVASAVKDTDQLMYQRLMEEAHWGLDYILRTRFSDGFRVTGLSIRRWTDNIIGNFDDDKARVKNHSFINFQLANEEAYASDMFSSLDSELSWKCKSAAIEDYEYACRRFKAVGLEVDQPDGHVKTASLSQYYAVAAMAAARLFTLTNDDKYRSDAIDYAKHIINSQEDGSADLPMKGFFYRDETKATIVHSSHQSRDYIFAEALILLCRTFPDSPEKNEWEKSLLLHGEYIKDLMKYVFPYSMIPAGIHKMSEIDDKEVFSFMNRDVNFEKERANYKEQLENGISIGKDCFIRAFPVWFSFRGNNAVVLANGKSASLLGDYFKDEELLQIAREQLYWILGKNPFGQSLIYGEGSRYGQNYTALLGETVGEIAVGIQTKANEDIPYWPSGCIATYREVWVTPATKCLMVIADILKNNH